MKYPIVKTKFRERFIKETEIPIAVLTDPTKPIQLTENQIQRLKSRLESLEWFFYRVERPRKIVSNRTKGATEFYFRKYLRQYFPNRIYTNLTLFPHFPFKYDGKTDSFIHFPKRIYHPDFVYFDSDTGLCIDIEIDVPYIGSDGTPINYMGINDVRDKYFTDNDWLVIRFSEKQVFLYPDSCCYEIGKLINKYLPKTIELNVFHGIEDLSEDECWDYETSKSFFSRSYRKEYLSEYYYKKSKKEDSTLIEKF